MLSSSRRDTPAGANFRGFFARQLLALHFRTGVFRSACIPRPRSLTPVRFTAAFVRHRLPIFATHGGLLMPLDPLVHVIQCPIASSPQRVQPIDVHLRQSPMTRTEVDLARQCSRIGFSYAASRVSSDRYRAATSATISHSAAAYTAYHMVSCLAVTPPGLNTTSEPVELACINWARATLFVFV